MRGDVEPATNYDILVVRAGIIWSFDEVQSESNKHRIGIAHLLIAVHLRRVP